MNNKITTILLTVLVAFSWSCESYLDVNHDPNVIEKIPSAQVMLPSVEVGIANQLMGWDCGIAGAFWSEYWTQSKGGSQFKSLCTYSPTDFGTSYTEMTAGVLNDLKRIKTLEKDKKNKGLYFIAETLSIFSWQVMTDIWGDVPYTEALKGDEGILSPKFNKGEEIYKDLNARMEKLLAIDLSKSSIDERYDFIYAGDLTKWVAFANSLKLKLMLRVSETSLFNKGNALSWVNSKDFISETAMISHTVFNDAKEGKRHPMREVQQGGANYLSGNVVACKNFIDYLKLNNDPRLATLFAKSKDGIYSGAFFGDYNSLGDADSDGVSDDKEEYSHPLIPVDIDLVIMSTWEVNFYIAEVYARNSDFAKAQQHYEMAVRASMAQHKLSDADATAILAGYAKWDGTTTEKALEQIAMQRWIANANYQNIESFLERNRTKIPKLNRINIKEDRQKAYRDFKSGMMTIAVVGEGLANGALPASPTYPSRVLTTNTNAPAQKTGIFEKVWWNKKAEY